MGYFSYSSWFQVKMLVLPASSDPETQGSVMAQKGTSLLLV